MEDPGESKDSSSGAPVSSQLIKSDFTRTSSSRLGVVSTDPDGGLTANSSRASAPRLRVHRSARGIGAIRYSSAK